MSFQFNWFRKVPSRRRQRKPRLSRTNLLERLETRTLLAGDPVVLQATDLADFPDACSLEVTTTKDGLEPGTLRHAVVCANLTPGGDTIELPAELGVFSLSLQGADENDSISGDLDLTASPLGSAPNDLIIKGTGGRQAIIDASALGDRVFDVHTSSQVVLRDLQIIGGAAVDEFGGGGLLNRSATVTISNTNIRDNSAPGAKGSGGGVSNRGGTMTIVGGTIAGNTASREGGGLWNGGPTMTISGTTISGNTASREGGGLWNGGSTMTIDGTTISGNTASREGGGLWNGRRGTMTISGTTIDGNTASGPRNSNDDQSGGGVANRGAVTITDGTITGNTASGEGGGLWNAARGTMTITDTTISGNTANREGGGLWNGGRGTMTIDGTTIDGNTASGPNNPSGEGGGIFNNGGMIRISKASILGNSALGSKSSGGGIANRAGSLTITQSTISGNTANQTGGGIDSQGGRTVLTASTVLENSARMTGGGLNSSQDVISILRSTIANNKAASGGGFRIAEARKLRVDNSTISSNESEAAALQVSSSSDIASTWRNVTIAKNDLEVRGHLTVENTIISEVECLGAGVISLGHNLDEQGICGLRADGDLVDVEALLSPLTDNGGPRVGDPRNPQPLLTHAIHTESRAVDAASRNAPTIDQRGFERPRNAADIGAFELQRPRENLGQRSNSREFLVDALFASEGILED